MRSTLVVALLIGGPLDGQRRVIPTEQREIEFSRLNTLGEYPERVDGDLSVRDGRYVWRSYTANPRRFDWAGWKE